MSGIIINMTSINYTFRNLTMRDDLELDKICSDPVNLNSTQCNKSALGISLSTPILMLSVGVLGNILALVVLYTSRREVRKTVFFTLLAGLAWTDVIGQMCTGPIAIITYANNLKWQGGAALCTYHGFVMVLFGILHPLIVGTMSLERFFALKCSYFYARTITRRKAQFTIVGCWMFTVFFCTWPLMGFGSFELQFPGSWCFLNFHRESTKDMIFAYLFAIINIAVITFIFVCNCFVVCTLLKMRRNRKLNNFHSSEHKMSVKHKALKLEMETEMVWFLGAVTLVFCTLWMPLNINILVNQISGQMDVTKDLMGVRLASINQILDPWLYILLRKAMFYKLLRRIKRYISEQKTPIASQTYSQHRDTHVHDVDSSTFRLQSVYVQAKSRVSVDEYQTAAESETRNSVGEVSQESDSLENDVFDAGKCGSETDSFLEPDVRKRPSFASFDDSFRKKNPKRRKSGSANGALNNRKLQRLHSLPTYLEGRDNAVLEL